MRLDTRLLRSYIKHAFDAEAIKQSVSFEMYDRSWPKWLATLSIVWAIVVGFFATCVCAVRGHDIVNDGYGGPESGCDAGHCTRCGWGWHVTLY